MIIISKEQQDELLCTYAALILHDDGAEIQEDLGRPILYTTTTQTTHKGWCIEAFVSIMLQSQSQQSLPGGGGV